ncbi:FIST C-terminal domain-containing protein [Candidatus Woesearchaeota archaeon]|nr:FIST C-terminal domain-containing protein [Candidatus Woesearchaeota archaeon]
MANKNNLLVGIGIARGEDSYSTALKATQAAVKGLNKKPTFAIIFADSNYNEKEILKAGNKIFGTNWIGSSTDTQFTSVGGYKTNTITVVAISTEYMHFGVGVSDNYHKNPEKAGQNAVKEALNKVKVDQYIDPYVQFRRAQIKSYGDIVKTPPYFILTLICGVKFDKGKVVPGMETEFTEGIFREAGSNIPIIGASTSTDFEKYAKQKITNNFQFANGKLYYDAGIVVFVVSNLYFSHSFNHGYTVKDKVALINKVDKTGHIIEEINGQPAVEEYARILGVSVDELMKDPFKYTLPRPFGVLDTFGNVYIKEAVPNPDKKTMYSLIKLNNNSAVVVVNYDKKKTVQGVYDSIKEADKFDGDKDIALALVFSCCGRKALLGKNVGAEIDFARKRYKKTPIIGFHTFGEIGGKMDKASQVCNQSVSTLLIYNKLLTE